MIRPKKRGAASRRPDDAAANNVSFDGGPVGYGKPPAHSQFKPGNRLGGAKKKPHAAEPRDLIESLMNERVRVTEGGKIRHVSVVEALVRKARSLAMSGDLRDIQRFIVITTAWSGNKELNSGPLIVNSIPGDEGL